jgi:thiamine pyrophosphokinase
LRRDYHRGNCRKRAQRVNIPPDVLQAADLWLIGPLCETPLPPDVLARNMPQVAIDGGITASPEPRLWIGDGDSGLAPADIPTFFKSAQDKTDLEFALDILRAGLWRRLHLSGFSGGRADHALAVLGAIDADMRRRSRFEQAVFYTGAGKVAQRHFAAGAQSFRHDGLFSVFALTPAVVSLSGACAYPAHRLELPAVSGRGVSNAAQGEVRVESDVPVIVMFSED